MKESIAEKCSQEILFDLDGMFKIRKLDWHRFWLEKADGDGMAYPKARLLGRLLKIFEEEF